MVGRNLLHYTILEKLGEGGMGVVYKARDSRLGRLTAIKVLPPEATASKYRFLLEARTAAALNHANIVTVYDIAEAEGLLFIAMEYIPGKTLHDAIRERKLKLADTLNYAIQIADALAKAHAAGVVHRDLKPGNIMLVDGQVKILDFGLAKLVEPTTPDIGVTETAAALPPLTQSGTVLGTPSYMSPEQAEGKPVDGRSDVFSFGAVLYEMVTGRRAFHGDSNISILLAILRDEPLPVNQVAPATPGGMEKIISRCLQKDRARRFQNTLDIKLALEELRQEYLPGTSSPNPRRWFLPLGTTAVVVAGGLAFWAMSRSRTEPQIAPPIRLTSDSGLSDYPALSPDGRLLAYASDRAGQNNLDLWIKQVPGGDPVRLTRSPADEYEPDFSPDGTRIVYRSEQDEGGIYVIPALGGDPRLLVKRGRSPRFSPDGSEILYRVTAVPGENLGAIYVVGSMGGTPRQIQERSGVIWSPVWTPDGKHILFAGRPIGSSRSVEIDWWVAPIDGGTPIKTGAAESFKKQNLPISVPSLWVRGQNRLVFSTDSNSIYNLWQVPISANWRIEEPARRLTFGQNEDYGPSVASGGRLAFTSSVWNTDIWAASLDPQTGRAVGELQRLTQDAAYDSRPFASYDGKKITFTSNCGTDSSGARSNVWLKDVQSGRETPLTFSGDITQYPIITGDGSRIAYWGRNEKKRHATYVVSANGGESEKVCDDCGFPRSWSPDQRTIILQPETTGGVDLLDVAARKITELLRHPSAALYSAQFSADGRWIVFLARFKPGDEGLFIAPFRNSEAPKNEAQWIPVTRGPALVNKPRWSVDGNLVYFTSDRDEFSCIWAQRLDPGTKRPVGAAFPVLHLHNAVRSYSTLGGLQLDLSVARDKVVFQLDDVRGNIWMTQLPD